MVGPFSHTSGIGETNVSMPICEPFAHGETYKIQEQLLKYGTHKSMLSKKGESR